MIVCLIMNSLLNIFKKPYNYASSFYSSKLQNVASPSLEPEKLSVLDSILSPLETYVLSLQSLLIWERPYLSAGAFLTINIFYWLIVSWNRRFFSIISIFALVLFLYKTWMNQIWPEIRVDTNPNEVIESWCTLTPGVLTVPELCKYLNEFLDKMILLWKDVWKLRKENHGLFCALMCGFFFLLALIGIIFPGVLIVYFLVLLLTLGPGVALHLIPSTVYDQIIGYFSETENQVSSNVSKCSGNSDHDSDIEEFIPEVSAEVIRQLSLKEDVPEIPSPGVVLNEGDLVEGNFVNESDDYSLFQGLGSFPSVEEEEESDLDQDISDSILPEIALEKTEMHFNLSHFKENSSDSESEVAFTEGLTFNPSQEVPSSDNTITKVEKSNVGSKGTSFEKATRKLSSDFEDELEDFDLLDDSDLPSIK